MAVGTVNNQTALLPKKEGKPKVQKGLVAAPSVASPQLKESLKLLYQITGQNPFRGDDPEHDTSLVSAFNKALEGGMDRSEFEDIMEEYYQIDEVTDEAWKAFTGGKENITQNDLKRCLNFFREFNKTAGYSFKWFLGLDKVYIIGGKEIGQVLKNLGIKKSEDNPEVEEAWNAAKKLTGDEVKPNTWDWFATILMTKFVNKLKDSHDFDDMDLEHPLMRQLFGKQVTHWTKTGKGMTDDQWDALIQKQWSIEKIEREYTVSLNDVNLRIKNYGEQSEQEKLLDYAIELSQDTLNLDDQDIQSDLAKLSDYGIELSQKELKSDAYNIRDTMVAKVVNRLKKLSAPPVYVPKPLESPTTVVIAPTTVDTPSAVSDPTSGNGPGNQKISVLK